MKSEFHSLLIQYITNGILSKWDYLHSFFDISKSYRKNAKKLIQLHHEQSIFGKLNKKEEVKIESSYYRGKNTFVVKMMSGLERELGEDLFGAYLHGSLATQEEIRYSDFDALVILKDTVFENEKSLSKVGLKLNRLQQIMHEFDPLQHHGWFVLTESMLKNYPISYFPLELFNYSVSLLPSKGLSFDVTHNRHITDFETPFIQLSNELLQKIKGKYRPQNSFALKSFLSEFMLLPTFYLQSKNKSALYKKHSFKMAQKDFSAEEWNIMDRVSKIRKDWNYEISSFQRTLLCNRNAIVRKLSRKYAPAISSSIAEKLTDEFYLAMSSLVLAMQTNIKPS